MLGLEPEKVRIDASRAVSRGSSLRVSAAGHAFVLEPLSDASAGRVAVAASRLAAARVARRRRSIPVVAVPFMGEAGASVCAAHGVSWFDLSGNARIVAPGLRVLIGGRENKFRRVGRPSTVFAPKTARVVRWLLAHAGTAVTQRELARAVGLSEGFVSRIVSRLVDEEFVARLDGPDGRGAGRGEGEDFGAGRRGKPPIQLRDAGVLLDAWRDAYRFTNHTIIRGHLPVRTSSELVGSIASALSRAGVEHAATGLAAAWLLDGFAGFRLATFFVDHEAPGELLAGLGFRDDPRGANVWLAIPNDAGVFSGAVARDGIRCVHPVQAYVDLAAHPERASDAAEHLRASILGASHDG